MRWAADRISHPDRPNDFILGEFDQTGCLIGIAGLAVPEQQQARHKATLFGMAVAVEAAGQGVGRALVERVLDQAKQLGLLQAVLTYSEGNGSAERLYQSCGFVQFGREPRAVIVDGMPVNKIHMVRILDSYVPPDEWASSIETSPNPLNRPSLGYFGVRKIHRVSNEAEAFAGPDQ